MLRSFAKSLTLALVLLLTMGIAFGAVISDAEYQALKTKLAAGKYLSRADIDRLIDLHDAGQSLVSDWELDQLKATGRIGDRPVVNRRPGNTLDEYVWAEATYSWVDITTTGTSLTMTDDDSEGPFELGFNFGYYDVVYDEVNICSNGFISFTSTATDYSNDPIPNTVEPNAAIYPFWDDFRPNLGGSIYYYADATNSRFIVSYIDMPKLNSEEDEVYTVQVIISSNGDIEFNYQAISTGDEDHDNSSCTVGIENASGDVGLQICHDGTGWLPVSNTAIRINQPDGVPMPVTNLDVSQVASDVVLTWTDPAEDTNGNTITPTNIEVWLGEPGVGTLVGTAAAGAGTYTHVNAPEGNLTYYVRAFLDPYYSAPVAFSIIVGNPSYTEDFEATGGLWESDNADGWQWGAPTDPDGPSSAHSGNNCWGTVLAGDYALDCCYHLTLDPGLTVNEASATLEFWGWYDTEATFDGCNLKVSPDGGTTWNVVHPVNDYPEDEMNGTIQLCIPEEAAYAGHGQGFWEYMIFPLADYVGQALQYRFTFGSDNVSIQYPGFYIDDMVIWGLSEPIGGPVSGTVTLDGGGGAVTDVTVRADGLGNPEGNPSGDGTYLLENVLVGDRTVWAELAGYHNATTTVTVPDEDGVTGVDLTLVRLDPPVPTGLDASVDNAEGTVDLTWDASTDPLVDRYNIFRKLQSEDEFVNIGSSGATSYQDDLNDEGPGIYEYAISAIDLNVTTPVESEMTDPVTALYGELPPSGLAANGNFDDKIVLDWFEPGTPPEFEIYYDDGTSEVGGIGFNGNTGWLVSKFSTTAGPAIITTLKVFFTSQATSGDAIQMAIFEDNGGVPADEPIFSIDDNHTAPFDDFRIWELATAVSIPSGVFYIGINQITTNNVSVGGDQDTPYINNNFYYRAATGDWTTFEPDVIAIPMFRCFAVGQFDTPVANVSQPIEVAPINISDSKTEKRDSKVRVEGISMWAGDSPMSFSKLAALGADAVASHAPYFRPVENRRNNNPLDDVIYYIVYRDDTDIAHPTVEHYEDIELEEDVEYEYYVTAYYDNEVESGATGTVQAACNMAPAAPTSLAGNSNGSQMLLTWIDPIANADETSCVDLASINIYRNDVLVATVAADVEEYLDTPPVLNEFYTWTVTAIDEVPNESDPSEGYLGAVQSPWEVVEYEWVDITGTGSQAAVDDDAVVGPFDLGFTFEFYGNSHTSAYICSNGFVCFSLTDSVYNNTAIPDVALPNEAIYPFWDDLNPANTTTPGTVHYLADAANDRFIVQWTNCVGLVNAGDGPQTFQVILNSTGSIFCSYHTIEGNDMCTIGVENADGTDAIQIAFNGEGWLPTSESAIEIWGGPSGEIAGLVRRVGNNARIEGAEVTVDGVPGVMAITNAEGEYSLNIEPGTYTIHAHAQGYCDAEQDNIVVEDNSTATHFFTLNFPEGDVSSTSINLQTEVGQDVSGQFDVQNGNSATCEHIYSVSADEDWVAFSPDEGSVDPNDATTITVNVNASTLSEGEHTATITIESNDEDSPFTIDLFVNVGDAVDAKGFIPTEFAFFQNYPNPFNATTALQFDVPVETAVNISIYNVMGQLVDTPVNATYPVGRFKVLYTADALPSGMYLVKMSAGSFNGLHKMVLLK